MNYAYIRVSTAEQNTDRQRIAFEAMNIDHIFEEKISGKDTNRPQLQMMLQSLERGDTVYITELSRLARSTLDFLSILQDLTAKGVELVSLKEQFDTTTPQGRMFITINAAFAEYERGIIKQRQAEGIKAALNRGVHFGKVKEPMPDNWHQIKQDYKDGKITAPVAMELAGMKRSRFFANMKEGEK